jgi:hypothetical protein
MKYGRRYGLKVDTVQSMIDGWGFNLITDPGSVILRNGTVKR